MHLLLKGGILPLTGCFTESTDIHVGAFLGAERHKAKVCVIPLVQGRHPAADGKNAVVTCCR